MHRKNSQKWAVRPVRAVGRIIASACIGLVACAAALANYQEGPFTKGDPWFVHPVSSSLGIGAVAPGAAEITLDSDQDGVPDTTYDLPVEIRPDSGSPSYFMEYRLSPRQEVLYAKKLGGTGVGCGAANRVRVYFYRLGVPPTLTPFTGDQGTCLEGPLAIQPEFHDRPASVRRTVAVVAATPTAGTHQAILWGDLNAGALHLDIASYLDGVLSVLYAPSGNVAFIPHGFQGSSKYTLADLCVSPTAEVPSLTTPQPLPQLATPELVSVGPDYFARLLDQFGQPIVGSDVPVSEDCCPASSTQACCFSDGVCAPGGGGMEPDACLAAGGTPGGPDTDCTTFECEQPCCMPDVGCQLVTPDVCTAVGGASGASCPSLACATAAQACCPSFGTCLDGDPGDCVAFYHGVPQGSGTTCGSTSCPVLSIPVDKTGPAEAEQGAILEYTIDWENTGDQVAFAATLADPVPFGAQFLGASSGGFLDGSVARWNLGDVPPGATGQVTLTVKSSCTESAAFNAAQLTSDAGMFFDSPTVVTTLVDPDAAPIGVTVSSVPRNGSPVKGGDLVDHTITLSNPAAYVRAGLTLALAPGDGMSFDAPVDPGSGSFTTFAPQSLVWDGSLEGDPSPSATTDMVFTTVADACINVTETRLEGTSPFAGTDVAVVNGCNRLMGRARADTLPVQRPIELEIEAANLAPAQPLVTAFGKHRLQATRPATEVEFLVTIQNPQPSTLPTVALDLPLTGSLVEGTPLLIPPVDPGTSYDALTHTIHWNGALTSAQTVTIGFRATLAADPVCRVRLTPSIGEGTCVITRDLDVAKMHEPPTEPHLIGLGGNPSIVWTFRPGIDTERVPLFCYSEFALSGLGRGPNGDIWVAGDPNLRFNPETLDLEVFHPDWLTDIGLTYLADVALDPSTQTTILVGTRYTGGPLEGVVLRYTGGPPEVIYEDTRTYSPLGPSEETVVESSGKIGAMSSSGLGVLRFDPAFPGTFESPGGLTYTLALDADGSYIVTDIVFDSSLPLGDLNPDTLSKTNLIPDLRTFVGNEWYPYRSTVSHTGDIYVGGGINPGLWKVDRSTLTASEILTYPGELWGLEWDSAGALACNDLDGDGFSAGPGCAPGAADCDDGSAATYPGAPETNDGLDNQCPGDPGSGLVDEISGAGFNDPADPNAFCWDPQPGASLYEVARSEDPSFPFLGCTITYVSDPDRCWVDPAPPAPGVTAYYLVRPALNYPGSWGSDSSGTERSLVCF